MAKTDNQSLLFDNVQVDQFVDKFNQSLVGYNYSNLNSSMVQSPQANRVFSDDGSLAEGVVLNGPHRDIKSSSKLPNAFRIFRVRNAKKIKNRL